TPQNLPGLGVKGLKLTNGIAVEHQTAGGGEHAGKSRHIHRIAPFVFACEGIISTELTGLAAIGRHNHPAEIVRTSITGAVLLGVHLLRDRFQIGAEIEHVVVPEAGLRIVGTRIPASCAESGGAGSTSLFLCAAST